MSTHINKDIYFYQTIDPLNLLVRPGLIDDESSIGKMVVVQALCSVLSSGRSGEEGEGKKREFHCSTLIQ